MKSSAAVLFQAFTVLALAIPISSSGLSQSGGNSSAAPASDGFPAWAFLWDPTIKVPTPDDKPNALPGSSAAFSWKQARDLFVAPDWHPNDHAAMPDIVANGRKPDVRACGSCHRVEGTGGPENASLAGLPVGYLVQQIADFKSGARKMSGPARPATTLMMASIKDLTDAEALAAAQYFSALKPKRVIKVVETDTIPKIGEARLFYVKSREGGTEPLGRRIAETPDETYKALGLSKSASPKELFEALTKRYHDEAQGTGKGTLSKYWEPIPISKYLNPHTFYKPPQTIDVDAKREQCVECHQQTTPGWTHSWQKSVHGNLDDIRKLPESDSRAYKKALLKEVEDNLHSMGTLKSGETLKEVGCIDCHIGVGKDHGQHTTELKMPDAAACGQCHVQQFAERESERDTFTWPQGQWDPGHPSHALSYKANVENAIWAAMEQREVAEGCTFCHTPQTTCNSCHTRHEFSAVEARKPQACAQCHNGVDHNEFENFMLSKHGTVYQTRGDTWDWNARLADAIDKGNMNAPTCQFCHMEYQGKFTHNMVRKSRWAFEPTPKIADNLNHPWFVQRKEAWV